MYQLLPAYLRLTDQKSGAALEQFLGIVNEQREAIALDLTRMYDGWFIETCDEWLVPYLADLVGATVPRVAAPSSGSGEQPLAGVLSGRRAVANAISARRRKGTLWQLEEHARDIAHWPARAVEFYRRLCVAAHLDHPQPDRPATADLHSARMLGDLDGPHDPFTHLGDVHSLNNEESPGRYNIPAVGLFVWRLRRYAVRATDAYCRQDVGGHCFTFSALGNDAPLFSEPEAISLWALEGSAPADATSTAADPSLYGIDKSLWISAPAWPGADAQGGIPANAVIPADLSDWGYRVPRNHVAVDPVLGRIAFPPSQAPREGVTVSYGYGFASDIGGGTYIREPVMPPENAERWRVWRTLPDGATAEHGDFASAQAAFTAWRKKYPRPAERAYPAPSLVLELMQDGVYNGRFTFDLQEGETVMLVAAPETRPVIWLADVETGTTDAILLRGERGARVVLDGLLIAGAAIEIGDASSPERERQDTDAGFCEVLIRHSTLVPGVALHPNCEPRRPAEPSIVLDETSARLRIESSVTGAIQVLNEGQKRAPNAIAICDSLVDATSDTRTAIGGAVGRVGYAELTVFRTTIVGRVRVHAIRHAEDTIFTGMVETARRQFGCIRYSFMPTDSRTPKRYRCQPDVAIDAAEEDIRAQRAALGAEYDAALARARSSARRRVTPQFESRRYGNPQYVRLARECAVEILRGAHDESEMGVYHDLFEPQRLDTMAAQLQEFLPASCAGAVIFAT